MILYIYIYDAICPNEILDCQLQSTTTPGKHQMSGSKGSVHDSFMEIFVGQLVLAGPQTLLVEEILHETL